MPHKTRKEKMLADSRRTQMSGKLIPAGVPDLPVHPQTGQQSHPYSFTSIRVPTAAGTPQDTSELTAIRRDLTKSVVLSAAAILLELLFYIKLEVLVK